MSRIYIVAAPYSTRTGDATHHLVAALVLAAIFAPVGTVSSKAILGLPLQYSSKRLMDVVRESPRVQSFESSSPKGQHRKAVLAHPL